MSDHNWNGPVDVDLSECQVGDQITDLLETAVGFMHVDITRVYLFKSKITDRNLERLATLLEIFPDLDELHLSDNEFGTETVVNIIQTIEEFRKTPQTLWLRIDRCTILFVLAPS